MQVIKSFFEKFYRHHTLSRAGGAIFYGILVAVAMNYFWRPGHIYSSGFNGLAQILNAVTGFSLPVLVLLVNLPMLIIAWFFISYRFAIFTILAVVLGSIMMALLQTNQVLSNDPIINAIFGGAINGAATGTALKYGVATGGLDVLGIVFKRRFQFKMGGVNLAFNALVMFGAGFINGWSYAFYSILGIIVSSRMIDMFYTRQQQMQVMIVTEKPDEMIASIQNHLRRGVTVVDEARGGYSGRTKSILFTVITQQERYELRHAMKEADETAFTSTWKIDHQSGRFYEPQL